MGGPMVQGDANAGNGYSGIDDINLKADGRVISGSLLGAATVATIGETWAIDNIDLPSDASYKQEKAQDDYIKCIWGMLLLGVCAWGLSYCLVGAGGTSGMWAEGWFLPCVLVTVGACCAVGMLAVAGIAQGNLDRLFPEKPKAEYPDDEPISDEPKAKGTLVKLTPEANVRRLADIGVVESLEHYFIYETEKPQSGLDNSNLPCNGTLLLIAVVAGLIALALTLIAWRTYESFAERGSHGGNRIRV